MSIAYQSWEIGSGPTVGYKLQPHQPGSGDGLSYRKLIYRAPVSSSPEPAPPPAASLARTPTSSASSSPKLMSLQGSSLNSRFEEPSNNNNTSSRLVGSNTSSSSSTEIQLDDGGASSSIVTSSISAESSDDDDREVQSVFKGPLEQMDSLMTTLPIRRSISKFYTGKSRSFTSLADVKSMPVKDLAKPENPYAKRRRTPSHNHHHRDREDKPRFPPPRVSTGISKKPISSSSTGTTLTLAVAMSTRIDGENCSAASGNRWQKSCRSFSLTDLQKA